MRPVEKVEGDEDERIGHNLVHGERMKNMADCRAYAHFYGAVTFLYHTFVQLKI